MSRISAAQRVELQDNAEYEILRFADDHALWHKHVHNVELDAAQLLKMQEMDDNNKTIDFSCRRTGKTAVKELWFLKFLATHSDQELGIVAPREAQSRVNLSYHTDAIRRSEILSSFLAYKSGRKQLADGNYELANRSKASAYGIMSQVDGSDLTLASIEEVDDMPADRLNSRFLLTMGSTRRLGASKSAVNNPVIRITGVFKGADTLNDLIELNIYYKLATVDCYLGIELGIIHENFILEMRDQLSHEEFIRQLLCKNISAKNLIWEKFIRHAIQKGVMAKIDIVEPVIGEKYKKRGLVSFGYDASGHGETPESSKYAFVVTEEIEGHAVFIFAKTWQPGTDETVVKNDIKSFWRYFDPDYAIGDAFGIGMITQLNDELFLEGLTTINRQSIGDGESTASTWREWAFSPLRFEGMTKHQMATALKQAFHNKKAVIAYVDHIYDDDIAEDMKLFIMQLSNIIAKKSQVSYSLYKMVKRKIGDDLFDAAMASYWGIVTRGGTYVATVISSITKTRDELLGNKPIHLIGVD